jgi:ABC-type Fe3+-hydroxamate transport system substrate-binding protein
MTYPRPARTLRNAALAAAASSLVLLAGCGTSQPTAQDEAKATSEVTSAPITLTDAARRTVELPAPAEKVVVLEWQMVEDVLTLGVEPVGVADVKGYNTWDTAVPLDPDTQDVGTRGEPNMDAVFSTSPDLVIAEAERGSPLIKQLEKYDVPLLVTRGADAKDPIGNMKDTFTLIAQALGEEEQAEQVLEEFDTHLEEAEQQLAEADLETTEFAFADAWLDGSNVSIRPFGQGSLVGELGESIGLTNVWKGEVDPAYGLGQTDIEGLTAIGDAHFFFTSTDADLWQPTLEKNPLWRTAGFVEADRVHPFPTGVWTFGGPRSSEQVIDAFVDALA